MKSKVTFDLDGQNKPIILAHVSITDDVRDKIARRFQEAFGHRSNLALVEFHPSHQPIAGIEPSYPLVITPIPSCPPDVGLKTYPEDLFWLPYLGVDQLEHLHQIFEEEIPKRWEALGVHQKKNILKDQVNHSIADCLKELKFGRPAAAQKFLDKCIEEAEYLFGVDTILNDSTNPPIPGGPVNTLL